MKKIFLILIFLLISNNVHANKILKSGFITKSAKIKEGFVVEDPKNKIIIILPLYHLNYRYMYLHIFVYYY